MYDVTHQASDVDSGPHKTGKLSLPCRRKRPSRTPTYDESNLAGGLLISTGHHGAHCVVDHSHHVQVKFLWKEKKSLALGEGHALPSLRSAGSLCCMPVRKPLVRHLKLFPYQPVKGNGMLLH